MAAARQVNERSKMDSRYFDKIGLTNEILEKILLEVPTSQIQFNCPWVCKRWTKIVCQPRFWEQKLKMEGFNIKDKIMTALRGSTSKEKAGCLYYATLYQEYMKTGLTGRTYISPAFFDRLPEDRKSPDDYMICSDITIKGDNTVLMLSGVLLCKTLWRIVLRLDIEVIKALPLLIKLSKARGVELILRDNYAFWNFSPRMDYLKILKGRSYDDMYLRKFWGCLLTLQGLPIQIKYLCLSIAVDDQNSAIDPGLSSICEEIGMDLHLKAGTNITKLPEMSFDVGNNFFVSCLEESHISWMAEVTKKFLNLVYILVFFNYQLDLKASEKLFKSMAEAGFKLEDEIVILSPILPLDSGKALNDLARTLWPSSSGKISIFNDENECRNHICSKKGIDLPDKI